MQQTDVGGDLQFAAGLMPSGAIEDQHGMRLGGNLTADLLQMQVHRVAVGPRQHPGGADATIGTDGAENIGPSITLIARRRRPLAALTPDVGQAGMLTDPGFVLT